MLKKIPMRMCVVTRQSLPKEELIRVVINKEGIISIDKLGKAPGRGVYLKRDLETINKAKNKKILNKALGANVPNDIYEKLIIMFNKED